jgi:hypothetical protein|tara:strand:- start:821 stop:985 length:165 start_codon:yes stop_codon:yes gene_type:complete
MISSLKGEMDAWDGIFSIGATFVMFNLAVHYFKNGEVPPVFYAYLSNFMVATSS